MRYNRSTETPFALDGYYGDADETWLGHYNYTRIHNVTISISPRAGTSEIDLSEVIVEISNTTTKCILSYCSSQFISTMPANGIFSASAFDLRPDQFGLIEIEDADNSCDSSTPIITRGDRLMITINASACFFGLPQRCEAWGSIHPENGAYSSFKFRVPSVLTDSVYDMYVKD
jgi:flagellin FlaB